MARTTEQDLNRRLAEDDSHNQNNVTGYIRPQNQNYANMSDQIHNKNSTIVSNQQSAQNGPLSHLQNGLEGQARTNFIKKVYLIVGLQLLITVLMCVISYVSQGFVKFQTDNYGLFFAAMGLMLVSQIVILCCKAGRTYPYNMIALGLFTFGQSYFVSFITAMYANTQGGTVVLMAAIMTLILVVALTLYAIFTKKDFTTPSGILVAFLASFSMFFMFFFIGWTPITHTLYCSLGIFLFGIYLVIDTQLIVGGRKMALSIDDYVIAALLLYIDIIQLFLYILSLLGGGNR